MVMYGGNDNYVRQGRLNNREIILLRITSKGSLCKGEPVSWSKLLRHNHLMHHTNSKYCDALVTTMMTTMIEMLMKVVMTATCSLESMARQVRTATHRIERTPTF